MTTIDIKLVLAFAFALTALIVLIVVVADRKYGFGRRQDAYLQQKWDERQDKLRFQLRSLNHEIRTPLTTILTHVEVLRMSGQNNLAQAESLRVIQQEAQRITRLTQDMLDLGQLELTQFLTFKPVDILIVAEEAVAHIFPAAESKNIELDLAMPGSLPRVWGDADRLKQVFLNLLDNAVKYSRPGDRVELILVEGREVINCEVRDTGPGIPDEHLPHVIERWYRGRNDVMGSGLGLSLVEEILKRHNTSLKLESHTSGDQVGTTAFFALSVIKPSRLRGEK